MMRLIQRTSTIGREKEVVMRNQVLTVVFFILAGALLGPRGVTADDLEETEKMIESMNDRMAKASIEADTVTIFLHYAEDIISMPNYGKMVKGKEALKKQDAEMRKAGMKIHSLDYATVNLWICGDLVCEIGTYGISLTLPGMSKPVADNGKYLNIWEKQSNGSFKIKVEIWNTDVNPWGT
jgi:ketosteroid isomerase-like protein